MSTVRLLSAFLVPARPPPCGIKSWHFSLTSSHQLQYSRKETLISSCFPLGHPSDCFLSYCSNVLVTKRRSGLRRSLCLRLCLSLAELLPSSLLTRFLLVCRPKFIVSAWCLVCWLLRRPFTWPWQMQPRPAPVCSKWCCKCFTALPLCVVLVAPPSWHPTWAVCLFFLQLPRELFSLS